MSLGQEAQTLHLPGHSTGFLLLSAKVMNIYHNILMEFDSTSQPKYSIPEYKKFQIRRPSVLHPHLHDTVLGVSNDNDGFVQYIFHGCVNMDASLEVVREGGHLTLHSHLFVLGPLH